MRYLIIALLLIPAWGWAEPQYKNGFITKHCTEFLLGDDPAYEVCVDADADGTMTWGPTCEQRMREAMRLMDTVYYQTPMIELPKTELSRRLNAEWKATYTDCVEGQ